MKKFLFLTYFWPPSGKATLHWPLKIIKYIPQYNWQPTVVTVQEETFTQKDESLLKEIDPNLKVIKTKVFEPFNIYKKFIGKSSNEFLIASETISKENKSLAHRISIWIRMNLFIPDARIGWYPFAVKELKNILQQNSFDTIVSIGPPHSTHLIADKISKIFNLPFIPIFIDPWLDIIYYKEFKRSKLTLSIDKYFEKKILMDSSHIIFITKSMKEDYVNKYSFVKNKSSILYWGYNEDDFQEIEKSINLSSVWESSIGVPFRDIPSGKDEKIILHAGNIFDYQNPKYLWQAIRNQIDNGNKLKIKFIGTVSPGIKKIIEENGLMSYTEYRGFLSYSDMIKELLSTDYLLVCATEKRHIPGKLFEYLRARKPILAFGDDNEEVKNIITQANAGMLLKYDDDPTIFFNKANLFNTEINYVKQFSRENITKEFSEILNSTT
ncbi:MAG: glycosyltransferase family 4 protein [Ignavibacterium sp.]